MHYRASGRDLRDRCVRGRLLYWVVDKNDDDENQVTFTCFAAVRDAYKPLAYLTIRLRTLNCDEAAHQKQGAHDAGGCGVISAGHSTCCSPVTLGINFRRPRVFQKFFFKSLWFLITFCLIDEHRKAQNLGLVPPAECVASSSL